MKKRIMISEILPPTWVAVHTSTPGRHDQTRWMIYDGADIYRGTLVRWHGSDLWSWQEFTGGDADGIKDITGDINEVGAAIFEMNERL